MIILLQHACFLVVLLQNLDILPIQFGLFSCLIPISNLVAISQGLILGRHLDPRLNIGTIITSIEPLRYSRVVSTEPQIDPHHLRISYYSCLEEWSGMPSCPV